MLKNFFKALAFGIRELIQILAYIFAYFAGFAIFGFTPCLIAKALGFSGEKFLIIVFVLYILEVYLLSVILHIGRALKYVKNYGCAIKEAWEATAPYSDPDDY